MNDNRSCAHPTSVLFFYIYYKRKSVNNDSFNFFNKKILKVLKKNVSLCFGYTSQKRALFLE